MKLVLSSYEENGRDSLSLFDIDLNEKKFIKKSSMKLTQPSFVISFQKGNDNYVITYSKEPITLMLIKVNDDKLIELDSYVLPYPFTTLTHLFYLDKLDRLYACSYKDGAYLRLDIKDDKFINLYSYENYKPSLCHQIFYNEDKDEINIVDIKNDNINVYDLDLKYKRTYKIEKNSGPRHALYKDKKIYLVTEYSNEVFVIDCESGKTLQKLKTIKTDCISYGATLFFIKNKLYVSNRGEETIAVFNNNSELEYENSFSVYGKNSRHMIKSLDEKYLLTCNMDSNELVIIDINTHEKILSIPYSKVSCVCEL